MIHRYSHRYLLKKLSSHGNDNHFDIYFVFDCIYINNLSIMKQFIHYKTKSKSSHINISIGVNNKGFHKNLVNIDFHKKGNLLLPWKEDLQFSLSIFNEDF